MRATVTMDDSYPTGGEALAASDFGLANRITDLIPRPASGYVPVWDADNSKLMVYTGDNDAVADGPGVEVADEGDLTDIAFVVEVQGD